SLLEFSTSPSSTTTRFLQISRSPLSGLIIISKFSSSPNFFLRALRKTSSKIAISVTRSISLSSLNSVKELINSRLSISKSIKCYHNFCLLNFSILQFSFFLNSVFPLAHRLGFTLFPLQPDPVVVGIDQGRFIPVIASFDFQFAPDVFFILTRQLQGGRDAGGSHFKREVLGFAIQFTFHITADLHAIFYRYGAIAVQNNYYLVVGLQLQLNQKQSRVFLQAFFKLSFYHISLHKQNLIK